MRARLGAFFVAALCGGLLTACFGAPEPELPSPPLTQAPATPGPSLLPPTPAITPAITVADASKRPITATAIVTGADRQSATVAPPISANAVPTQRVDVVPGRAITTSAVTNNQVEVNTLGAPAIAVGPVRVYESRVTLPTYPIERYQNDAMDPVFDWPYKKFDMERFEQEAPDPAPRQYRLVVLENDFLKIMVMPELGGRIWQVIDKATGQGIFYQNSVIKPTAWGPEAQKGWLAAGGLEWGIPVPEHGYDWGAPWGYIPMQFGPEHGAITVFTPRDGRLLNVSVTISLKADEAGFTIEPTITNEGTRPLRFDFWHSAMLPASADVRFVLPTDEMSVHSTNDPLLPAAGQRMTWPIYRGRDWSRLSNWRQYAGLFESPQAHGPAVAVYDGAADAGVVRIFPPETTTGSKIFSPGWDAPLDSQLYTDDGSTYVEIHGGLAPSFAQQTFLQSNHALSWSERWYPVHGLGMMSAANDAGALGGRRVPTGVEVSFYTPQAATGSLALHSGEQEVERRAVNMTPGALYRAVWPLSQTPIGKIALVFESPDGTRLIAGAVK